MARPRQTHCKRGHEYNDRNTYYREDGRIHSCAICNCMRSKLRYRKDEEYRRQKLQQAKINRDRKKEKNNATTHQRQTS